MKRMLCVSLTITVGSALAADVTLRREPDEIKVSHVSPFAGRHRPVCGSRRMKIPSLAPTGARS